MFKVLLADMDRENIQNFKRYIDSSYPDFKVLKTLGGLNGDSLVEIINSDPDLIVTDVRFFGTGGAYSFSEISRKLPSSRFILYGGYNDMDYLEHAIDEGRVDYIIKPVKPSDLGRALESARIQLKEVEEREKQLKELSETFKSRTIEFRSQFMQALITGVVTDEDEIKENFRYFGVDMKADFTAVQIKIDHFKVINMTLSVEEKHYLIYRIFNIADLSLADFKHFSFINGFNTITVIVSDVNDLNAIMKPLENVRNEVLSKLKVAVTIGIGRTYEKHTDIPISYNEAESATSHRFYIGYNTIIPIEFVEGDNFFTYRYPYHKEKKLVFAAASGEFDYCKNLLNEIFDALRKSQPLPEKLVAQIVICILISMERFLIEQGRFTDVKVGSFFSASDAMRIKTVDEGYSYLYSNLQKFCESVTEARREKDAQILVSAKDYVKKKYYESISLTKAALELKTTPDYLNRLMLSGESDTYYDYVTKERLLAAKRLLAETELDEKTIAVNVGYDDSRYFKAVFRQHEKMEPLEYRLLQKP